jgi:hypothetical protein
MVPRVESASVYKIPYPYGKLSRVARLVIGLKQYSQADDSEIAAIVRMGKRDLRSFWTLLKSHEEGRSVIENGLPAMFGEELPEGIFVRCNYCSHRITTVPCVVCYSGNQLYEDRIIKENKPEPERRKPPFPTTEAPGTIGKIKILKLRVAYGFQLWHPNDGP